MSRLVPGVSLAISALVCRQPKNNSPSPNAVFGKTVHSQFNPTRDRDAAKMPAIQGYLPSEPAQETKKKDRKRNTKARELPRLTVLSNCLMSGGA